MPLRRRNPSAASRSGKSLLQYALHGTSRVILMVHTDCGAYGGLQAFDGNKEREAANHESQLRSAADFLTSNVSTIAVECYYLTFTGV